MALDQTISLSKDAQTNFRHAYKTAEKHSGLHRCFLFGIAVSTLVLLPGTAAGFGIVMFEVWNHLVARLISNHYLQMVLGSGLGLGLAYITYGLSLMVLVPMTNRIFRLKIQPSQVLNTKANQTNWYLHNGIHYIVRYTFFEWTLLTPVAVWYLQAMGGKIGKDAIINSSAISDICLVEIEDYALIGGSAKIMAHYSNSENLVFAPVVIKKGAAVGANSVILGGVTVGEGAKVLPNSYVKPNTFIPAGEVWAGVPAVKVNEQLDACV